MENMILFGTLGSRKQEGELWHGSRHLFFFKSKAMRTHCGAHLC